MTTPFKSVLIANRGAIACRVIRTLKRMDIASVAVYSEPDTESLHVQQADTAIALGGRLASESYLDGDRIIALAREYGVEAIHPGYGFLSENTGFAQACEAAGIAFIGPAPSHIEQFGLKHTARELAQAYGVPLVPGTGLLHDLADARSAAQAIGFPVMLKSTAGGGGIGMQVCEDLAALEQAWTRVRRLSQNNFGHDGVFLEKYIARARHVEIQAVGDGTGRVVTLGERECSLQRRNQKVIEETPAPRLSSVTRDAMCKAAIDLLASVHYRSAGTVEFILDDDTQQFYFLEVNTRLQVEHGVTEAVTGIDLVEWMIRIAGGDVSCLDDYRHAPVGHAIQARVYAEDAGKQFQPSAGRLTEVRWPSGVRCDHWIEAGIEVPAFYDPMLAKIIAFGSDRDEACKRLSDALAGSIVEGIVTNLPYLAQVLAAPAVREGRYNTRFLNDFEYLDTAIEVLSGGTQTTVQDVPGRVGFWAIGIPPSGPMDDQAFRLGNHLVGNAEGVAGLEMTLTGPTLAFRCAATIALTGADMGATLDGVELPLWTAVRVPAGGVVTFGRVRGGGLRSYLCVAGGIAVSPYMGSCSTFTLGQFGGHGGRALRTGDVLRLSSAPVCDSRASMASDYRPVYPTHWDVPVILGPHGAPDFFTSRDLDVFFSTDWEVHFNSSRTGVRLIGPAPEWARADGGEAGLHPSNIHDNAYAIGAVDFTGDMPVILGPDGPSLGGFVCPVAIARVALWMMGQLAPGNTLRFHPVSLAWAVEAERQALAGIAALRPPMPVWESAPWTAFSPIMRRRRATADIPEVVYRVAGDDNVLVEYGPLELDLALRFRVHALMTWIQARALAGIIDLTPGIRSLQVHYDSLTLSSQYVLDMLEEAESALGDLRDVRVPSRVVHLPLSWDDPSTRVAIEKYMTTVRSDAPWCPSNIEFIRRINGLDTLEDVQRIVFDARYLVMGLGDVYLGAPVATPLDPRHRLVTTKYNPARTWTPENAVGIGGAYLCVYGMEGPGGYQFVGRTVQMWNRYRTTAEFTERWLLRFFDQIRFFPVTARELERIRRDFPLGRYALRIESEEFSLDDYQRNLATHAEDIARFQQRQRAAFADERARWSEAGDWHCEVATNDEAERALSPGEEALEAPITGSLWQLRVTPGVQVEPGMTVAILESMKMEFPIIARTGGRVAEVCVREGQGISAGQRLIILEC